MDTQVLIVGAINSGFARAGGTLVIRSNTGRMVQVTFSVVLDRNAGADGACHLWGTATTG